MRSYANENEYHKFFESDIMKVDSIYDDLGDVQVGVLEGAVAEGVGLVRQPSVQRFGIVVGEHGDAFDVEALQGSDDANGDLSAVGDQDFMDFLGVHAKRC